MEPTSDDTPAEPELLAVSYLRVSTREQAERGGTEEGFSIPAQREANQRKAADLGAIINLDDLSHIDYLKEHIGLPDLLCFRYNPGSAREGNVIIGKPEEAKYGFTEAQLFEGYGILKAAGVKRFGLHTMVASNERRTEAFVFTAKLMFELAVELKRRLSIHVVQFM